MKRFVVIGMSCLAGCAYNPPIHQAVDSASAVLALPINQAWDRSLSVLVESGYTITASSKESGVISTGEKYLRLDETKADCGNIWGLPYTKDHRTQTLVSYTVRLSEHAPGQTKATITTNIKGKFVAYAGSGTTELQCRSLGYLEKDLADRVAK